MVIFMVMDFTHLSGAVELRVEDATVAPGEDVTEFCNLDKGTVRVGDKVSYI